MIFDCQEPKTFRWVRYCHLLPFPAPATRITSYNVCYTKLLRQKEYDFGREEIKKLIDTGK